MKVSDICNRRPVTIGREDTIQQAAMAMREKHAHVLVVVEGEAGRQRPVGVLTDHDIVASLVARTVPDLFDLQVGDVLTHGAITADLDESVHEALRRASAHNVRRLPVVDASGHLVGMLSIDDMLGLLSDQLSQLARLAQLDQYPRR